MRWTSRPLEYKPKQKVQFATLAAAKNVDDLRERTKLLFNGQDQAGEFYRRISRSLRVREPPRAGNQRRTVPH